MASILRLFIILAALSPLFLMLTPAVAEPPPFELYDGGPGFWRSKNEAYRRLLVDKDIAVSVTAEEVKKNNRELKQLFLKGC